MKESDLSPLARDWLAGRPPIIRKLFLEYPPGTKFLIHGKVMHSVGFNEDGGVLLSEIDPSEHYELAVKTRVICCACCANRLVELKIKI